MTPQEAAAAGLGWVDENNPNYGKPGFVGGTKPSAPPKGNLEDDMRYAPAPGLDPTPADAAAAGLGWVDRNHPLYGTPGYVGSKPATAAPAPGSNPTIKTPADTTGAPGGGTPGSSTVPGVTNSTTPNAAPTANTTNQGTQDAVRNSYLERAMQPVNVDPRTNEAIRTQSDAFGAAAERARRDAIADTAEGLAGTGQAGLQTAENRLTNERAAQARGAFEADLVKQELTNKRQEVAGALDALRGMISDDQTRALTDKLAQLDAQLKTAALDSSTKLGSRELDIRERLGSGELSLRDKLGMGGLNIDLMGLLLNNKQFGDNLGFNIADREAFWNDRAISNILMGD